MLTWLLINIALSVLALVFIALNSAAPHRLRFFAGFAALVAWLVPWPLLPDLLPVNIFSFELWRIERVVEASSTRLTGVLPVVLVTSAVPRPDNLIVLSVVELAFVALSFLGCVLFAWKLFAHRLLLRQLARKGGDGNWLWARCGLAPACPVHVQRDIAGAFSTGLLRPRIWVHGDLVQSPQLATVLRHELTHIRQHDNWYLLAMTFVERLFWWNPLVWYLGRGTRALQELSCDELCQRADAAYPAELAQLMLDSTRGATAGAEQPCMLALAANIFSNPNPNVQRIKLLQRSYPMLTRHILAAGITAATAVFAVGFVTAQPDATPAGVPGQRVHVFRVEHGAGAGDDVLFVGDQAPGPGVAVHQMMTRGAGDQFVKIDAVDGEPAISFSFTETPLPGVLMPLVGFISHSGMPPLPLPGEQEIALVRALDEDAATIYALPPERVQEIVRAEGGAVAWSEDGDVVTFAAAVPGPAPTHFGQHFSLSGPLSDKLVLEYPEAANRIVSVTGTNLTLDEAIELIAAESGCNIFQDGDTIVVDYCEE